MNSPSQSSPERSAADRLSVPIELRTLTDGGQTPTEIARELATFLGAAHTSLDIAVSDVRFETDAGALVLATISTPARAGRNCANARRPIGCLYLSSTRMA